MRIKRAASIPLVLHDPFFSIWSSADHLYDEDTVHWSGAKQPLRASVLLDGEKHVFLGDPESARILPQCAIDVTATATEYTFENERVRLTCRFTSPLLLEDMVLVSRPCTYVDIRVQKKADVHVQLHFEVSADLVRKHADPVSGFAGSRQTYAYACMGRTVQQPLSGSDDKTTIDWGYAYLACQEDGARVWFDKTDTKLRLQADLEDGKTAGLILAYDDLLSINYFGQWRKAYWTQAYATILDAIAAAFADKQAVMARAAALDCDLEERARAIGGESYAYLCDLSYRQAVAAHKLITDEEGNVIFLSKENASNGCIGTVDVSYPSVPLFLLYDTEYVKGMLRPIFKFASCDVWDFDFAPHDVGRYPYAWGQVYAFNKMFGPGPLEKYIWDQGLGATFPPFYMYPAGSSIYDLQYQMPVEECGNMLIMTAAVCVRDGDGAFAKPYMGMLKQWKDYLVKYGADPGSQLCTDDFAGHLEHNVNLSVKAIMGIQAYATLARMLGDTEEADAHCALAKEMAASWEKRALAGDHYMLAFGSPQTWSLKYNLVWDRLWNSKLFSEAVYRRELSCYEKHINRYGTPLDSRRGYTKSDWLAWCAAMAENGEQAEALLKPVAQYLENTQRRVPFGDWYETDSGASCFFMGRSVQGGMFMPLLAKTE